MWKWWLSVTIVEQEDPLAVFKRQEHDASIWSNLDERKSWLKWDPVNLFNSGPKKSGCYSVFTETGATQTMKTNQKAELKQ